MSAFRAPLGKLGRVLVGTALFAAIATAPAAAFHSTYFVAPSGSDGVACAANSSSSPFASIQRALVCAGNGDVVQLAASGATPYPGVGAVNRNVTIKSLKT